MAAPETRSNIDRLHAMLKEISVDSNVTELNGEEHLEHLGKNDNSRSDVSVLEDDDEGSSRLLKSLEYDFEEEDSWLYKSPHNALEEVQTPEKWTGSDLGTPELIRVRGALSSKLDLITLENRKDQFDSLVNKHSLKSSNLQQPKTNPQVSQADAEMLDWEYDEDYGLNQDVFRPTKNAWKEDEGNGTGKPGPFRLDFEEQEYDDLKPMTLDFESPPTGRHSSHAMPRTSGKLRRTSSGGSSVRHADKFDLAVDELVATPTGNVRPRPSKYQFERSDSADSDSFKGNDQSDAESIGSNYSDSSPAQPRGLAKMPARDETSAVARPRGKPRDASNGASPRGSNSNIASGVPAKARGLVRPRTSPSSGGIARPRGSPQTSPSGMLVAPRGIARGVDQTPSPGNGDSSLATSTPRSSLPQPRKSTGIASPRGLPVARPRQGRSRSPDPKAIPRGSTAPKGTYAGY